MPAPLPELPTKRRAAWRGAQAGMLWATVWTVVVTGVVGVAGGAAGAPAVLRQGAPLFSVRPSQVGAWAGTILLGAGLAGALAGLVGRRLRARRLFRVLWLWLAFFPCVALGVTVTFGVFGAGVALVEGQPSPFANPVELVGMSFVATVLFSPALAIPLLLAALHVERWTRPA